MRHSFYDSEEYKERQRKITRENSAKGVYNHLKKDVERTCIRLECEKSFIVIPSDAKKFCSQRCSALVNNAGRVMAVETRRKISKSMAGRTPTLKTKTGNTISRIGIIRVPREERMCINEWCSNSFVLERWKKKRFCSASCAAKRSTSPKASRGKSGARPDISDSINFHSRWEANMARIYNHENIEWQYEPKTFDIGNQMYTPDFYLPKYEEYIEVKNFWHPYSVNRDEKFRTTHPSILLTVVLREEYLTLQKMYSPVIPQWEFSWS